ncbi:hypothetical protein FPOA_12262 [Fusarium poae]|uniref:HAT C-terminal dimerisation domain-containing protein n=1 Tax=Fusarium poae TaxID=36050 RepID=A0A1B8A9U8_FUSPO|nr:hypothetical protein FPOA_12262 [Fusarium poae]
MSDIISQLPNEILRIIMENVVYSPNSSPFVTSIRDLKSATEVPKRIRSVCLPIFWQSVEIRPKGISHYTDLPDLLLLYLSPISSKYIKHLHFRKSLGVCWRFYQCPHSDGPRKADLVVYDLDDDDLYDLDDGNAEDDELDYLNGADWGTHSRNFDHLSFASGIIVNGLSHRQLRSFSWDLGTCIPETILGPSGIITLRQDSVENISLTTDRRCFVDDDSTITWCPHTYNQEFIIHLDNFKNLKSFRWRGPRCEDIDTLSSAINNNRTNLIKLELDFDSERRWVCRLCIERNRPKPGNVVAIGTQNAERHLWDHHKIQDPSGKRSALASRKKPSTGYQTITKAFIACFFRNEDGKAGKLILGVPELTVRHFGANIGHEIIEILESYEISEEKIGYFTLDNAQNNDTAMDTIRERFKFHGKERLSISFGEREVRSASSIIFIQRLEFDASEDPRVRIRKPLNVVADNETRWLSQLYMIRRALKLRPYLETLVLKHKQEWEKDNTSKRSKRLKSSAIIPAICRDENKLGDKDWDVLEAFGDILQSFEDAVKALEGDGIQRKRKQGYFESCGNVWDVIVGYEFLLAELEKAKAMVDQYPEPEHFKVNINLGWKKLDEYYNKLDETPIYYTSLALHPAYRWGYFETVWSGRPAWISKAKDVVQSVWDRGYKTLEISTEDNGESAAKRERTQYYSPFERYKDEARIRPCEEMDSDNAEDEYARWQKDVLPTDNQIRDPLEYWHAQRFKYPRLSRMAVDFMTVQPMSAECERLFSAAGRMVTPLRNQLEASTIAICQVLRSWLQAGIVEEVDPMLLDKVNDTMGEDSVEENSVSEWLRDLSMQMREEEVGWE